LAIAPYCEIEFNPKCAASLRLSRSNRYVNQAVFTTICRTDTKDDNVAPWVRDLDSGSGCLCCNARLLSCRDRADAAEDNESPLLSVQAWPIEEPDELHLSDATLIYYVTQTGADSGDCSTPTAAYRTIQYAVNQAGRCNEVRAACGTYTDAHARSRDDVSRPVRFRCTWPTDR
jgi:hypothetical protein